MIRTAWRSLRRVATLGIAAAGFASGSDCSPAQAAPPELANVYAAVSTHHYRVQIRHPKRITLRAPNQASAKALAAAHRGQGWSAKVKKDRVGYTVTMKMSRWKTRATTPSKGVANNMAHVLRSQGFQTRLHAGR